jgi:hypothetical protein
MGTCSKMFLDWMSKSAPAYVTNKIQNQVARPGASHVKTRPIIVHSASMAVSISRCANASKVLSKTLGPSSVFRLARTANVPLDRSWKAASVRHAGIGAMHALTRVPNAKMDTIYSMASVEVPILSNSRVPI